MKTRNSIKQRKSDNVFDIINITLLIILAFIFIYPLWFILIASISDPNEIWSGNVILFPKGVSFTGYERILQQSDIWIGYRNSIFYTIVGVCISLFMTVSAAYPLSRKDFKARNLLMGIYAFTMFFTGGLIPSYLLVKGLGMIDSVWAILLPSCISVYNVIVTRTYFQNSIPHELYEAAAIDGCTNFKYLLSVVLPLSKPILAVMALFYGVSKWNEFFNALIYLSSREKFPLQLFLKELLVQSQITSEITGVDQRWAVEQMRLSESIKYGVIVVASLPVLMIYPFVQKHLVKGIMVGSIKG